MSRRLLYRVSLYFPPGLTRSVFVKAKSRAEAQRIALDKYPDAQINRSSSRY